ncbi:MAG: amidohydrolase family protein [Armatimonadetes bacterium]|nr:amidohydrolase family protein [Armatimonadota bacterium]
MRLSPTEAELFEALREIPVIDAHEHLVPEAVRLAQRVDFSILFAHYCCADLVSAGMAPADYQRLVGDQDLSPEEKWKLLEPYYPMIQHGSYARPARIWLKQVLGLDELTADNCREVSESLEEGNRPGLYQRILRDMCHIESALVDNAEHHAEYDMELLKPLWRITQYALGDSVRAYRAEGGLDSLDDYLDWMMARGEALLQTGAFGLKLFCFPYARPRRDEAEAVFRAVQSPDQETRLTWTDRAPLLGAVCDRAFELARREHLTVAVHSGVWGDFRESHPCHLIALACAHPQVRFDLFHLGMPFVREAVLVGKMYPNVTLNLCWNTVVSPELTVRMLDECLDLVPLNNLIVFGADYRVAVEKVYGHLVMAKQAVARSLAKRIDRGQMDVAEALRIARLWFHDNAVAIYGLSGRR